MTPSPHRSRGFTLIEAVFALFIVGVALLLGMGLVLNQQRTVRRLEAQAESLRAMESALEAVRGGALPLSPGRIAGIGAPPSHPAAHNLLVWLEVYPLSPPGLYEVRVRATYTIFGDLRQRMLRSLVWTGPPP